MPGAAPAASFRITYQRYAEVRDDMTQMARGGLLVKLTDVSDLSLDAPVALELILPDGSRLTADSRVLHAFPGVGVAISISPELLAEVRRRSTGADAGAGAAHHERRDGAARATEPPPTVRPRSPTEPPPGGRPRTPTAGPTSLEALSNAEKIQLALHGNRDQRNAILRDANRTLHPFVLKNPQVTVEDAIAIAKNGQTTPDLLRMLAERKEWFQRPQMALALARNPKTPPDVAVRALDYVPADALRHMAKGSGAPPHVIQAARKKVLG